MTTTGPIRVLAVAPAGDDSDRLAAALQGEGDIVVVARAADAATAASELGRLRPDVVALDLGLPARESRSAIARIMRERPTPILVLSPEAAPAATASTGAETARTPTVTGAPSAREALAAGAVEAVPRPPAWTGQAAADLRRMVRRVGGVPVIGRHGRARTRGGGAVAGPVATRDVGRFPVVGIAASTGGPAALAEVLTALGFCEASVLVVQHIHPSFAEGFAAWLARASGRPVATAAHGERLRPGRTYVAPGDRHLRLGTRRTVRLDEEPATLHRPSADVLFESLALEAGPRAIGVVLTGMGADGVRGLAVLHAAGGRVLAQDEASSVVFGMPQAAVRGGVVDEVVPLAGMAAAIRNAVAEVRR